MARWFAEWWVLCCRNVRVLVADRFSLGIILTQAPLLASLTLLAFNGFETDDRSANYFCRAVRHFHEIRAECEARGMAISPREMLLKTRAAVDKDNFLIGASAAQRRAALYFVLISATVWIGVLGSCREVVAEKDVLFRELRSCTRAGPYLLAKVFVLAVLVGLQTAVLAAMIYPALLGQCLRSGLILWGIMWMTGCAATCLGLLVSSLSANTRVALTLVPLLMVPQLLLGGLLRPPAQASEENPLRAFCERLTIQRWGFEAALKTDRYASEGVVAVAFGSWDASTDYGELGLLKCSETGVRSLLFREKAVPGPAWCAAGPVLGTTGAPVVMLAALSGILLLAAYAALKIRFLPT